MNALKSSGTGASPLDAVSCQTQTPHYGVKANYYYHYLTLLRIFHTSISWWNLNDSKSPHVSKTLLSILADFNRAVIWMVCTCVLISNSSSPFTNPLETVRSAPIIIGIIVTFIFHSFSVPLQGPGTYLSFHLPSILLCDLQEWKSQQFSKVSVRC